MKIAFVLGLLLIGTVAAIFFRNEPSPEAQTPHLDNPEALAEELQDTDGPKPYLQDSSLEKRVDRELVTFDEIETDDEFSALSDSSPVFKHEFSYEELPATPAKNRSVAQKNHGFEDRSPSPIPRQEAIVNQSQTVKKLSPKQAWDALSNLAIEKRKSERAASTSKIRIHRVRRG
ncbi:MAG: hypothetical protein IID46_14185, partial [Planctomycetes bacterium]|nr:hypothetical protein [Planctomycetota bacterium]